MLVLPVPSLPAFCRAAFLTGVPGQYCLPGTHACVKMFDLYLVNIRSRPLFRRATHTHTNTHAHTHTHTHTHTQRERERERERQVSLSLSLSLPLSLSLSFLLSFSLSIYKLVPHLGQGTNERKLVTKLKSARWRMCQGPLSTHAHIVSSFGISLHTFTDWFLIWDKI